MKCAVAALLLVVTLGSGLAADREKADPLVEAGRKAMAVKDWAKALAQFQAAAKEEPALLAAHRGWAEAALGAGKKDEALRVLHAAVLEGEARDTLAGDDVESLMAMRKKLAELDPASATLEVLLKKHGEALASLGAKYLTKDPVFAETISRAALAVLPDHAQAQDRLARLKKVTGGKKVSLFNGSTFQGWVWAEPGKWGIKDGLIVANMLDHAMLIRTTERFEGDFDVVLEAQLKERSGRLPLYVGVEAAYEGDDAYVYFGCIDDGLVLLNHTGMKAEDETILWAVERRKLDPPVKAEDWTTYELQFSAGTLRALVNGKLVHTASRPAGRKGGYIAVKAQGCVAHYRKVEIVPK